MKPQGIKIPDIIRIENSFTTLLVQAKADPSKYGIVYMYPGGHKFVQLFNSEFAFGYKKLISDFRIGFTTGAIVGLARARTPADAWQSDTIERSLKDKNSIHQGILRIIKEEDGIPVFIKSTSIIGNIAPALGYLNGGNPLEIKQALERYNYIQKSIVSKIEEGKPRQHKNVLITAHNAAGDGFKSDSRADAISRALDSMTISS